MKFATDTGSGLKRASYLPAGWWNRVFYLAPVVVALVWGATWITIHAPEARGITHPLFQSLALVETVTALLLRRRKPVGALASILAVYMLVDLEPTTLLPVLIALFTVAEVSARRIAVWAIVATALLVMAMPYIHKDAIDLAQYSVAHLTMIALAAAAGLCWRLRQRIIAAFHYAR
jgi:hypothetical protein